MLTNSLKVSDITKTDFFELIFFQSDQKIWQKYLCSNLSSLSDPLTCWLFICVLTRGVLGMLLTPHSWLYNFRKKSQLRLIFCLKVFHIWCRFRKCRKNLETIFWFSDNSIWIGSGKHSLLLRENTFHRVSIC